LSLRIGFACGLAALALTPTVHAQTWRVGAAFAADAWFSPQTAGQGIAIADVRGRGLIGGGDLHFLYNTDTLQVSVENVPVGSPRLQFNAAVRGEALIAGVLTNYFVGARKLEALGFFASYVLATASLKWLPAERHSLELVATGRRWFFGRNTDLLAEVTTLPPVAWVFEPRLRYTFWNLSAGSREWGAEVLFPRVTGVAAGVELGIDLRDDTSAWGAPPNPPPNSPARRNQPGAVIFTARQWLRAGVQLGARVRLQFDETASWGAGEDDLTRVRVGGMNPYVVAIPGLPWPALLCERLVAGQVGVHIRPSLAHPHELGVAVAGGAFNDVRRTGALSDFDGAGGAALFGDLRFGRWQVYARAGWAFPVAWLDDVPHVSAFAGVGAGW
jgi:hypothetical protein